MTSTPSPSSPVGRENENRLDAGASPFDSGQAESPATLAARIVAWDRAGRLVDNESFIQNSAPAVADAMLALLEAAYSAREALCIHDAQDGYAGDLLCAATDKAEGR